ncbi:amidohydrolase family protein [Sphingobacterium sp. SGG-5]|uniref:amidohydrolase family protein n=1 Tax=Sphingobacterium sp. SGG-5 TaxID=2710881 RepID=UPI0013EDC179|nr:amidohydrolase family protein [Sphingobacterium sp. SGG-5]NGM60930.1 amidohydrolase family protein [Sphingobacterium sp. SGG-5]
MVNRNRQIVKISDAHVHFWNVEKIKYPWLDNFPKINMNLGIEEYDEAIGDIQIENIVFVQCECEPNRYRDELHYINHIAQTDHRIQAIVSYFPLEYVQDDKELADLLREFPLIKGIRRLEEHPSSLYKNTNFIRQMDLLLKYDLSFDLCVTASQIPAAVGLVESKPEHRFVLDHFGKPNIKANEFKAWEKAIKRIAAHPQTYCKLSGLVTEADWQNWDVATLKPYFHTVLKYFGSDRLMFGSDWPVVTLATSYDKWYSAAIELCDGLDLHRIFYANTLNFYKIATHE